MEKGNTDTRTWAAIRQASRHNRMFFDNLTLLLWCECKAGNTTRSTSVNQWADIELPSYSEGKGGRYDPDTGMCFNTPKRMMSPSQLAAVQRFIDSHTFDSVTDAREQLRPFLGDCITSALGVIAETVRT